MKVPEWLLQGDKPRREAITLEGYLSMVLEDPRLRRGAHAYLYDALMHRGTDERGVPLTLAPIVGGEAQLNEFLGLLKAGASGQDVRRRILLLVGPPGSGKSTFVYLLKRALEAYSYTDEGAIYAIQGCPIHEDPLRALPDHIRPRLREEYGIVVEQHLCPHCRYRLEEEWGGDISRIPVERIYISEAEHRGIGVFVAGEPNTQDASQLIGSVDLGGFSKYGRESHPMAWAWDGALLRGNRGIVELVEVLKAKPELLHYLLTTAQERQVPVDRLGLVDVDTVLVAHTNWAEFNRFWKEVRNEAIRDRTRVILWPYPMRVRDEERVHALMLGKPPAHIAPWVSTLAAGLAVLSRLAPRKDDVNFPPLRSLRLWNTSYGENGYPTDRDAPLTDPTSVREDFVVMRKLYPTDGYDGLSPRLLVDWISAAAVASEGCLNPIAFTRHVLTHYVEGQTPITKQQIESYIQALWAEYDLYVEKLMQRAFATSFEAEAEALWKTYLDHASAFVRGKRVQNPVTGEWEAPNTVLLEKVERAAGVPAEVAKTFRSEILALVGALAAEGEAVKWNSDPRMAKAIESIIMGDRVRVIRSTVSAIAPSEEDAETIRKVKECLTQGESYCEKCASWVLDYYAEKSRRSA